MQFSLQEYKEWFSNNENNIKEMFSDFLTFPSISTDLAYREHCLKTATWLEETLRKTGMTVEQMPSSGLPVVFGEHIPTMAAHSLLIYNHYDVQPVDPLEEWATPPFESTWRDEVVYARGASDNKGQCLITIIALWALLCLEPDLPLRIKFFIEGEEESGSKGTLEVLEREAKRFQADYLCVLDFDMASLGHPALVLGYRGLIAMEIECKTAETDLHSGVYGGIAINPLQVLSHALSACTDSQGHVVIPGFYEGMTELSQEEERRVDFSVDVHAYKQEHGLLAIYQEEELVKRGWIYPTFEINGLIGGYTGDGFKTVIPAKARAKVSCRLVPGQDPHKVQEKVEAFLQTKMPQGVVLSIKPLKGAPSLRVNTESALLSIVLRCLEETFGVPCCYTFCGGSVPVVSTLAAVVKGDVALFGFALSTDNIHAPNEHMHWSSIKQGFLAMTRLLWQIAHS